MSARRSEAGCFLRRYAGGVLGLLLAGLVCVGVTSIIELAYGVALKRLADAVQQTPEFLNSTCLFVVGLFLARWIFSVGQLYSFSLAGAKIARQLRGDLFRHVQTLSLDFFQSQRSGRISSLATNDVTLVQSAGIAMAEMIKGPVKILGGLTWALYINYKLTLLAVIALPVIALLITRLSRVMRRATSEAQHSLGRVSESFQENVSGAYAVKAFGQEAPQISKLDSQNSSWFRAAAKAARTNAFLGPTVEVIGSLGVVFVLYYAGHQIIQRSSAMDFGSLLQFLLLMWNVYNGAKGVAGLALTYNQGLAASDRLLEVFSLQPTVREAPDALPLPSVAGDLEMRHVSFSYDLAAEVVRDVTFRVKPGEQVALVGPSGSGKTTVIALAARLYDPASGEVLLDGHSLRELKFSSLRRAIAIVPQDALLFGGTICENILFGREGFSPQCVEEAAELANARDFICALPRGYETEVGERGALLSGGQRQRIAIARALLAKPKVLLLDEATAALDPASEQAIKATLESLRGHVTTLIIAHRLTTVRQADRILVLEEGRLIEEGAHGDLLATGGAYAKLVAGAELTPS